MKVLITGSDGFIGKNLRVYLQFLLKEEVQIFEYDLQSTHKQLIDYIKQVDFIFHLAGENRPKDPKDFISGNVGLTQHICDLCSEYHAVPILYASSTHVQIDNDYGRSKLMAEKVISDYAEKELVRCLIYRLPNVFGKWARPNYNSFITTLCYNIARDLPVSIDDREKGLALVYVDDVVASFVESYSQYEEAHVGVVFANVNPVYSVRLGEVERLLSSFKDVASTLIVPKSADGFQRALYATYLSYLPCDNFSYDLPDYSDDRGSFYEVLKTDGNGQVSISTTKPGITRGNHFHHTKNEKFIVIRGEAKFQFRCVVTDKVIEIDASEERKQVIEVPPGYTHNFTNTGACELIVLLWVNEIFDRDRPDTYFLEV